MVNKDAVYAALGIEDSSSQFLLWSDSPYGTGTAYTRGFYSSETTYGLPGGGRGAYLVRVVCLGE